MLDEAGVLVIEHRAEIAHVCACFDKRQWSELIA
jgi:hypothetical protein